MENVENKEIIYVIIYVCVYIYIYIKTYINRAMFEFVWIVFEECSSVFRYNFEHGFALNLYKFEMFADLVFDNMHGVYMGTLLLRFCQLCERNVTNDPILFLLH